MKYLFIQEEVSDSFLMLSIFQRNLHDDVSILDNLFELLLNKILLY
jgi:hypothetical protein